MIRALGALEIRKRGGVVGLPLEPARQPRDGFVFGRARALDPERIAGLFPLRVRDPLSVALDEEDAVATVTD